MRFFLIGSLLILLTACADQAATAAAPSPGSASPAVDLGSSSRIPRIAASAGEGEGYGMAPPVPMDHSKMDHGSMPDMAQAPSASAPVQGSGTVNSVDPAGHKVTLNHNPIPAIGWPAMTMDFAVAQAVDLVALKPGARVTFTMQRGGDGMYVIQSMSPERGQ